MSGRSAWAWAAGVVALAAMAGTLAGGTAAEPARSVPTPAAEPARPPPAAEPEPAPSVAPTPQHDVRAWGHFVEPASWARGSTALSTGCAPRVEFAPEVNPLRGRFALVVTTLDLAGRPILRWVQERWTAGETTGTLAGVAIGDRRDRTGTRYRVAVYVVPDGTPAAAYRDRPRGWVRASKALTLTRATDYVPCA